MMTIYWFCLGGGFALTLLMLVVGEALEAALDALDSLDFGDAFDPLSGIAGVTVFGAAGIALDSYAGLETTPEVAISILIGLVAAVVLHFVYVKPMKKSENSTGFSVREYVGKTGELTTGIPEGGFGEVTVQMGASTTFQTASSFDGSPIPNGTAVVVVEVDAEGTLRVAPLGASDTEVSSEQQVIQPRLQIKA
ncbi:MAG: NfeD family protein [Bacteroidota bacterium]